MRRPPRSLLSGLSMERGLSYANSEASAPDPLLPSQYFGKRIPEGPGRPEKRLMLAVLEDVFFDIQRTAGVRGPLAQAILNSATTWLASRDRSWLFSFERICEALDINPDYLRRGIRVYCERAGARAQAAVG